MARRKPKFIVLIRFSDTQSFEPIVRKHSRGKQPWIFTSEEKALEYMKGREFGPFGAFTKQAQWKVVPLEEYLNRP